MSWDDLSKNDMLWPAVREVIEYRRQVRACVLACWLAGWLACLYWVSVVLRATLGRAGLCSLLLLNGTAALTPATLAAARLLLRGSTNPAAPACLLTAALQVYQMVRRHIETHPDFDRLPVTWVSLLPHCCSSCMPRTVGRGPQRGCFGSGSVLCPTCWPG